MSKLNPIFSGFLMYVNDDVRKQIKADLADYFDLPNRTIELAEEETRWIGENLNSTLQVEILGKVVCVTMA